MADYLSPISRPVRWLAIIGLSIAILVLLAIEAGMIAMPFIRKDFAAKDVPILAAVIAFLGFLLFVCCLLLVRLCRGTRSEDGATLLPPWVIRVVGIIFLAGSGWGLWTGGLSVLWTLQLLAIGLAMLFVGRYVDRSRFMREIELSRLCSGNKEGVAPLRIRVVDTPPGSPPEWVRRAWIGLELPTLPGETGTRLMPVYQINYGLSKWFVNLWRLVAPPPRAIPCYLVPLDETLAILDKSCPEAAEWWRTNAPELFGRANWAGFVAEACEEIR